MLHRLRSERLTDFGKQSFTLVAFRGVGTNLDQLVADERAIGFLQHGWSQASRTDENDGIEVVGRGAQTASCDWGQHDSVRENREV
jgi:hypothetical protein